MRMGSTDSLRLCPTSRWAKPPSSRAGSPVSECMRTTGCSVSHTSDTNAWIESFNGRLRDELLNAWRFDSLLEAKVLIEEWRIDYNLNRPHSAHGDLTPSEFAQAWIDRHQPVPA